MGSYQTKLRFPGFGQHNNQSKRHGHIEDFAKKDTWFSPKKSRGFQQHTSDIEFRDLRSYWITSVISEFSHQESPANWWIPSNLEKKHYGNHGNQKNPTIFQLNQSWFSHDFPMIFPSSRRKTPRPCSSSPSTRTRTAWWWPRRRCNAWRTRIQRPWGNVAIPICFLYDNRLLYIYNMIIYIYIFIYINDMYIYIYHA